MSPIRIWSIYTFPERSLIILFSKEHHTVTVCHDSTTFYVKYSVLSSLVKVLLTCLLLFRFLGKPYHINMRPCFLQLWKKQHSVKEDSHQLESMPPYFSVVPDSRVHLYIRGIFQFLSSSFIKEL